MKRGFIFIILFLHVVVLRAQDVEMDSLKQALKAATHDTTRCRILNEMVETEVDDNIWPRYNISMKLKAQYNLRKYKKGHPLYKIFKKYLGLSINNIGYLYSLKGDVYHALEYYNMALDIQREIRDRKGEATTYNNLGSVFDDQGEHEKAFEYYRRSYNIQIDINDKAGLSISLLNIGFYHDNKGHKEEALDYYMQSLGLSQQIGDPQGQVYTMNNISLSYLGFKRYDKARQYAQWAMELSEENGYSEGLAFSYSCLGNTYLEMGEINRAREYGEKSYAIATELGFPSTIGTAARLLSEVYEKTGDHKKALQYYKTQVTMRDSVENEQNKKLSIKKHFQLEYAKKAAADSMKTLQEERIREATFAARQQKEKIEKMALYGGLALVFVFAVFMFNRFRVTKRQSRIIELKEQETRNQKNLIFSKQKEIIDSINYAHRIQSAILTSQEEIRKYFPDNFLLYKPKDIVAGDFYFFETTDTHVFYAAADCTGHGVPGALVSVICSNALTRCVKEFGLTDPGKILDKTRELVLETFRKSGQEVKDGMDISLISLRFNDQGSNKPQTLNVEWAGANNALWIIRSGNSEVEEIKPDKQPIGLSESPRPFTTHRVQVEKGSEIILFTDGYADQFGGEKGKKFKYKNLAKLLIKHFTEPMPVQARILDENFEHWKGALEQVDDICVIGIKV